MATGDVKLFAWIRVLREKGDGEVNFFAQIGILRERPMRQVNLFVRICTGSKKYGEEYKSLSGLSGLLCYTTCSRGNLERRELLT